MHSGMCLEVCVRLQLSPLLSYCLFVCATADQLRVAGELLAHFSLLLEKKELLRKRLQQVPGQGSLTMEAPYHKWAQLPR